MPKIKEYLLVILIGNKELLMKRYVIKHIPTGKYLQVSEEGSCYLADNTDAIVTFGELQWAEYSFNKLLKEFELIDLFPVDKQEFKIIEWTISEPIDEEPTALANSQYRNENPEKNKADYEGFNSEEEWDEFKKRP